jgi:HD superfamily phosphodiesterase
VSGARAGVLYLVGDEGANLEAATLRSSGGETLAPALAPPGAAMAGLVGEGARSGGGCLDAGQGAAAGCDALFGALGRPAMAYLALPLLDREHARVGLLVLWFDEAPGSDLVHFVEALSGTAALSVETRALIRNQKRLFESFLQLLAHAIDAKSRYTGGHCARVPELTKMLARAACEATSGPFRDFALGDDGWETLHVAAWLHDCGKVTTPEFIVDKATKLETLYDRIHEIRMRFEVLKRDATIACCEAIIAGEAPAAARARLADELAALDADFAFVAACNAGGEAMAPADVAPAADRERRWLRTSTTASAYRPKSCAARARRSPCRWRRRCSPTNPSISSSAPWKTASPPTTPGACAWRRRRCCTTGASSPTWRSPAARSLPKTATASTSTLLTPSGCWPTCLFRGTCGRCPRSPAATTRRWTAAATRGA